MRNNEYMTEKVKKWIDKKPKELIFLGIEVEPLSDSICLIGDSIPKILERGFSLRMNFHSNVWDKI